MIITQKTYFPDGRVGDVEVDVPDDYFDLPPEPAHPLDPMTQLQLALAELAELIAGGEA
jgi:hypothetical protein